MGSYSIFSSRCSSLLQIDLLFVVAKGLRRKCVIKTERQFDLWNHTVRQFPITNERNIQAHGDVVKIRDPHKGDSIREAFEMADKDLCDLLQ